MSEHNEWMRVIDRNPIIIIIIIIIIKKDWQYKAGREIDTLSVRRPQPHTTNL